MKAYHNLKSYFNIMPHDLSNEKLTAMKEITHANFLRLNVYVKDSKVMVTQQVPTYALSNLWSDIGGTIGLWAGLSFITVIEVIMLVITLIQVCLYKRIMKRKKGQVISFDKSEVEDM